MAGAVSRASVAGHFTAEAEIGLAAGNGPFPAAGSSWRSVVCMFGCRGFETGGSNRRFATKARLQLVETCLLPGGVQTFRSAPPSDQPSKTPANTGFSM